jgi:hypothetical protein
MKLAIAALALLTSGCNAFQTANSDGGADASASTTTAQTQCTAIWTAFCMREPACAIAVPSISQCVADGVVMCCGSKCASISSTSESDLTACTDAITTLDCNSVATMTAPAACAGIPKTN